MNVFVGESESDDEGSLAPHQAAQPSATTLVPSPDEDTLIAGSSSTAQPTTDVSLPADSDTVAPPEQRGGSHLQKDIEAEPHSQSQSPGWVQSQSSPDSRAQTGRAAASIGSPFLERLAAADGASSAETSQHAQHASHSSTALDAQTQQSSQSAAGPASDQATGLQSQPNQARHAAEKAQEEDQQLTAALAEEEAGAGNQPAGAADPMAAGQALAGILAFQHELQQRSSERQARAGALLDNAEARQDRGDQGAQGPHQRTLRCCA